MNTFVAWMLRKSLPGNGRIPRIDVLNSLLMCCLRNFFRMPASVCEFTQGNINCLATRAT
jgi:hypothetical protein